MSLGVYGPSWGVTYIIPAFVSFSRSDPDAQELGTLSLTGTHRDSHPVVPRREESRVLVRISSPTCLRAGSENEVVGPLELPSLSIVCALLM